MFALVEWQDEKDDGSWSIVPTSHIRNFDINDFMDGLDDRATYIIEWRAGLKKKPRGGWPLYEAAVHKIAEKQSVLENVMKDKQQSPEICGKRKGRPNPKFGVDEGASMPKKRQTCGVEFDKELLEKIKSTHGPVSPTLATPLLAASPSALLSATPSSPASPVGPPSTAPSLPASPVGPPSTAPSLPASPVGPPSTAPSLPTSSSASPSAAPLSPASSSTALLHLQAENEALKRDLDTLNTSVVSYMPKLISIMEKLEAWLDTKGQSPQPQLASLPTNQETLEMYPGSGVYVPKNVWWSASHANSPTTMARVLLLGVFNIDTLLKSNLRGGKSKKAGPGEAKEALDVTKVDALMMSKKTEETYYNHCQ
ncbi:uncharacterized protein LOC143476061 isoform X2 [Brachyhypopomus gauderio]|uniref:uncharacterized protein LOC143476061 isoform X2 n=1 Tax=Brachyhypopomus gauderio TaxID=698409 RepID=UPI0040424168